MKHLPDWLRRQRAQLLVNFDRVRIQSAGHFAERTLVGTDELSINVLRDVFVGGEPGVTFRNLDPPFDIVEESIAYRGQRGLIKRFLRFDLTPARAQPLGDVVCLAIAMSNMFYHWFLEILPKAVIAEDAGFTGTYLVPPYKFARDSLLFLGIPSHRIVEHRRDSLWRVERAFVFAPIDSETNLRHPEPLKRLRGRLIERIQKPSHGQNRRLYLSRNRLGVTRHIVNELEFKRLVARFGFEEYFGEDRDFGEQLADFTAAEAIIGSHGAAFAKLLVAPEGALAVELFSPLRVYFGVTLPVVHLLRHRYYPLVSELPGDAPYSYGEDVVAPLDLIATTLKRELG